MRRVGARRDAERELSAEGIAIVRGFRGGKLETRPGTVVGATLFSAMRFAPDSFDRLIVDEAAQVPLANAPAALLAAPRITLFGDDRQLGPVVVGEHEDSEAAGSLFAHLRGVSPPTLLDETHRLNDALCRFPAAAFYEDRLRPSPVAGPRRFSPPAEALAAYPELLAPDPGAVLAVLEHEGYRTQCPPERELVVGLAGALLDGGLPAGELAIVSPFRLQNREIQAALAARQGPAKALPVVDTVERIQGQEREVVLVSLTCSDPDALRRDTRFFYSPERLNVTLTRARSKLIVVGSPRLLDTYPRDLRGWLDVGLFHRLFRALPRVEIPLPGSPSV